MRSLLQAALVTAALFALSTDAAAVGTRRIALRTAEDLKAGELQGVAVDSSGVLKAGFNLGKVPLDDAATVWAALEDKGRVLLATGSEGRLLELKNGATKELAKADAMALTSLVRAWGDMVIVGSLPGAKLFAFENGKLVEFLTLKEADHIFGLAFDEKEQVLYAATGPEGKLFRITRDKKAQVYFDAEEPHLVSVAVGGGKVYAGGGDQARLYALSGPGRATVLFDFGRTEVRAIAVSGTDVYAIANELKDKRSLPSSSKPSEKGSSGLGSGAQGKGTLYRFDKSGAPEQLLDNTEEHFTSLALDAQGTPYVGTGVEGRLYTVNENHNSVLAADTEARQITALLLSGAERHVISADPSVAHPIRGVGGAEATWTSKALDAGLRANFGRLDWSAEGEVELSTRSGNTGTPDDTWSPWSAELRSPASIQSPAARFIQVRARFSKDAKATLREITVPFVTDNLRAIVTSIESDSGNAESPTGAEGKLLSSGGPITESPDRELSLKWEVDNPDKDELLYRLHYRLEGTQAWFDMLPPNEKLTKNKYNWNTRDLPEGRYRVRVSASDELTNPPSSVKRHQRDSHVVLVDNTAPEVTGLQVTGRVVRGFAVDGVGPIARIEASLAGTDSWIPFAPIDGIFDSAREEFSADLTTLSPSGPALLTLRVYDQQHNQTVRSVTLR
ncbi:MAG: hypothetical protein RJA70_3354 [Pseudomonadota bacterium]|jgi:hypothetical protein